MGQSAASLVRSPVIAVVVLPVMLHLAIVGSGDVHPALTPRFAPLLKLGFVTAAALAHWAIYCTLLVTFALTLRRGREPIISRMARGLHGKLSQEMVIYTRRVTFAWAGFFGTQLATSITLFCFAPLAAWSFFVNILDMPLVATMFAAEYLIRLRCLRDPPRHSMVAILRMIADVRKTPGDPAGSA